MKLKDFFLKPISPSSFIQQTTIVNYCDFIFYSNFFCENNYKHFGLESIRNCISEPPNKPAIIMCRFKDNEINILIEKCREKKYNYIIVQTLIGDDGYIDEDLASRLPENIISVYSKNIKFMHPKLKPIPIGRDWRNTFENNRKIYVRTNLSKYKNLAYLNFSTETCKIVREKVLAMFLEKNWVTIRQPFKYGEYQISHSLYLEEIYNHKFCFSPVGKALDCYRTWDTLFVKSIPIVDWNQQVSNYLNLPILFTNTWEEISSEYLESKYFEMLESNYDFSPIFASYWQSLFLKEKKDYF